MLEGGEVLPLARSFAEVSGLSAEAAEIDTMVGSIHVVPSMRPGEVRKALLLRLFKKRNLLAAFLKEPYWQYGATAESASVWASYEEKLRRFLTATVDATTPPTARRWYDDLRARFLTGNEFDSQLQHQGTQGQVADDINEILNGRTNPTTRDALIQARIGQGRFREQVLQLWDNCCSVTSSATQAAIRASHIQPWRESNDEERLDPNNGLPLVASLDALFDSGLISFESSGKMIVSSKLNNTERQIFGVGDGSLAKKPTAKTAAYLSYHRENCFQK